jgi:HipA-like C-terminal domain
MRPRNEAARAQLLALLARRSAVSAPELAEPLGISTATLHRLLHEIGERVVTTGKARRTRYGLRRELRGDIAPLPVYEVDAAGRAGLLTNLTLVRPTGSCMPLQGTGWPVPEESTDGWWDGLPYPLYDMRPQGYMGRQFARARHRQLEVSEDPREWNDNDVVHVLSRGAPDASGSLIVGDPAFELWQAAKVRVPEPLKSRGAGVAYAKLADEAIASGVAGSSAAGEFPKFAASVERPHRATPHVLVKFSGADGSSTVSRWSDLLVAEHLALECATSLPGVRAAESRIVFGAGRTFLEVQRFDRHGVFGRSRLASLATLNAALLGEASADWTVLAARFQAAGLVDTADVERIAHLWWFGRLIGNTDMHGGNLSFEPHDRLVLAPAYDMLPMLYAPLAGGELPTRAFVPALPLPPQRAAWSAACAVATEFWKRASRDSRIGEGFRRICAANAVSLQEIAERI